MSHWVDLGDGVAIDASRVGGIEVSPPQTTKEEWPRRHLEDRSWTVDVLDSITSIGKTVASYYAEGAARHHARLIVELMHQASN